MGFLIRWISRLRYASAGWNSFQVAPVPVFLSTVGYFVTLCCLQIANLLVLHVLCSVWKNPRAKNFWGALMLEFFQGVGTEAPSRVPLVALPGRVFTVWHQSDSHRGALWCHILAQKIRGKRTSFWCICLKSEDPPSEFNLVWCFSWRAETLGCSSARVFPVQTCAVSLCLSKWD